MKTSAANEESKNKSNNEYILNSTHEEMITPIAKEFLRSYKDFPAAYYQIQTKFRNESRAKSGILRGREFRMKDLYSFHVSEDSLKEYYENSKQVYLDIYKELGLGEDTFITLASGGDFTKDFSHEFQTTVEVGEDEIYLDRVNKIAYNKEVVNEENENKLGVKFNEMEIVKACEVGNIFPLGTKFSKAIDYKFVDKDNEQKEVYMGSYGIGPSRLMGVITEKYADEKGLVWPKVIAPFGIHLVSLHREMGDEVCQKSEELYKELSKKYEVLWDDREGTAGQKLNDADLFGITLQIIVGEKGILNNEIEIKTRKTGEVVKVPFNDLYARIDTLWQEAF
jgi:prolyl-tRNA synthetase